MIASAAGDRWRLSCPCHADGKRGVRWSLRPVQVRVSSHPFPVHNQLTATSLYRSLILHASDTSTVFKIPYEIFQEIILNLPVCPWSDMYFRHLRYNSLSLPMPRPFWERARTLLALGATCKAMRQAVLMEAWRDYAVYGVRDGPQIRVELLPGCEILLKNFHLAAYVRYGALFVHLEYPDTV